MPHSKPAAALPMQLSVMLPQLFIQGLIINDTKVLGTINSVKSPA